MVRDDLQQTVADSLPDEKPSIPGMPTAPVSPKEFVEKAIDFVNGEENG